MVVMISVFMKLRAELSRSIGYKLLRDTDAWTKGFRFLLEPSIGGIRQEIYSQ
jgi:hypothetical protein